MQALVLLTFAVKTSQTPLYPSTDQECTCCAAIPNADYAVLTAGAWMLSEQARL